MIIPDEHMKTSWEKAAEGCLNYVYINAHEVIIGSTHGSGHTDNAVSCSHERFLEGFYHDHIEQYLGRESLQEIIASVERAGQYEPFIQSRQKISLKKKFISDIPEDLSISSMLNDPATVKGNVYYGNAGGYSTELITERHRFFVDSSNLSSIRGYITDLATGETSLFNLIDNCVSVVELEGDFYIQSLDNLYVIDSKGRFLYSSYDLKDERGERIFGAELRVGGTLRCGRTILVQCWWVSVDEPGVYLKFDRDKLAFTGRWSVSEK